MEITASLMTRPNEPLETVSLELSDPRPDEVLVRLAATGICASDAHTHSGRIPSPAPCVLGHEGAGVVERIGSLVGHVAVGDHVALSWMPSCGACRHCVSGRPVLCTAAAPAMFAGTLLDGTVRLHRGGVPVSHYSFLSTFATHAVVPASSAIRIDRHVPLAVASLVGCGVLTGYGAVVNRARVGPGSSVVVFGAGGVGLSAVMAARLLRRRADPRGRPGRREARGGRAVRRDRRARALGRPRRADPRPHRRRGRLCDRRGRRGGHRRAGVRGDRRGRDHRVRGDPRTARPPVGARTRAGPRREGDHRQPLRVLPAERRHPGDPAPVHRGESAARPA